MFYKLNIVFDLTRNKQTRSMMVMIWNKLVENKQITINARKFDEELQDENLGLESRCSLETNRTSKVCLPTQIRF